MIHLANVTKLYGPVIGVNDVTLSLEPGAYGLLGPNGSGKTTLLNLITGQLRPTMGEVRVLGESPWRNDSILRRIGLCPALDMMYANVSGLEWVRYLVELHGFRRSDAARRAESALQRVGVGEAMHRAMGSYSLGMRQRTKLAQSLAHDPELLILDEPFNGLDPIGRHEMTELLRNWTRDGRSLVLASHILHEIEAISPAFVLIHGGRILASGTADEARAMSADVPHQIRIRCDRPQELARRLLDCESIETLEFTEAGTAVVLATRSPLAIYRQLPELVQNADLKISEIRSLDESLPSLFDSLLRMHRGEI